MNTFSRREFVAGSIGASTTLLAAANALSATDRNAIYREIERRHDEALTRMQGWLRQPSIAAENLGKAHLAKRGFGDIEVVINGGVNYTSTTSADSVMIRAQQAVYESAGIDAVLWPRAESSA